MNRALIMILAILFLFINSSVITAAPCNCYMTTIGDTQTQICSECAEPDGTYVAPVPEPGSLALIGLGLASIFAVKRYRKNKK